MERAVFFTASCNGPINFIKLGGGGFLGSFFLIRSPNVSAIMSAPRTVMSLLPPEPAERCDDDDGCDSPQDMGGVSLKLEGGGRVMEDVVGLLPGREGNKLSEGMKRKGRVKRRKGEYC